MPRRRKRSTRAHSVFLSSYYFLGRLFVVVSFGGIPLLPSLPRAGGFPFLVTFLKLITSAPSTPLSLCFFSLDVVHPSVRVLTLPFHLFPAVATFLPHVPANGSSFPSPSTPLPPLRPLAPNSSGSRLVLRDVFPTVAAACPRVTLWVAGTFRLSAVNTAALAIGVECNPRDESANAFDRISHFPRGCREIERGSLPITHCPLQLKLPDRAREYRLSAGSIRRFFGGQC